MPPWSLRGAAGEAAGILPSDDDMAKLEQRHDAFTPIINAPEVAILGVSKATIQPVWDGQAFQPKLMLPLSLSYDHRVIDGAAAARFTAYMAQVLADLRRLLV